MTTDEIKAAVDAGRRVHWVNEGYVVHKDSFGHYLITFEPNGHTIGLTNAAGTRLNGQECDFYIADQTADEAAEEHRQDTAEAMLTTNRQYFEGGV